MIAEAVDQLSHVVSKGEAWSACSIGGVQRCRCAMWTRQPGIAGTARVRYHQSSSEWLFVNLEL
jgi:hypothetical protein